MKIVYWLCCFGLGLAFLPLSAQPPVSANRKADKWYQEARQAVAAGQPEKALELLDKAAALDSSFSVLYLLRADIFHRQGKEEEEMKAIGQAIQADSLRNHAFYYFVLAEGYFDRGNYTLAQTYYRLYLEKDQRRRAITQARRRLEDCAFALHALQTEQRQEIFPVLETDRDVYWPALDVRGKVMLYTEQEGEREQMWMLRDSCRIALPFEIPGSIGASSLTADGQMMYFTVIGNLPGNRGRSDIYVAYRLNDTLWSEPVNLGEPVNTEGWEAQPAISADGTQLYFASNREGGRGGSDIWYSRLLRREPNGRQFWSSPKCLYFNTPGDEMAPFLYFDNRTLFFSSDGYPGMGRKDIYKVDVEAVSQPQNIGITVNTHRDELGFVVDASGKWGYFASDIRNKKCIFRYPLPAEVRCTPAVYIRLNVRDEEGRKMIPDRLTMVQLPRGDTLAYYDGLQREGDMLACVPQHTLLLVSVVKKGYMYYSDTLKVNTAVQQHTETKEIVLRRIQKDRSLVLKGVFFDVDDYYLRPESAAELQQVLEFMRLNPDVQIEIAGYTDNSGSAEYNLRLSENRAFEVFKYLFVHRIRKERMSYRGYGKENPVASNDTEEGKAKNRRTEIRIK